jgi:hypothetical protein
MTDQQVADELRNWFRHELADAEPSLELSAAVQATPDRARAAADRWWTPRLSPAYLAAVVVLVLSTLIAGGAALVGSGVIRFDPAPPKPVPTVDHSGLLPRHACGLVNTSFLKDRYGGAYRSSAEWQAYSDDWSVPRRAKALMGSGTIECSVVNADRPAGDIEHLELFVSQSRAWTDDDARVLAESLLADRLSEEGTIAGSPAWFATSVNDHSAVVVWRQPLVITLSIAVQIDDATGTVDSLLAAIANDILLRLDPVVTDPTTACEVLEEAIGLGEQRGEMWFDDHSSEGGADICATGWDSGWHATHLLLWPTPMTVERARATLLGETPAGEVLFEGDGWRETAPSRWLTRGIDGQMAWYARAVASAGRLFIVTGASEAEVEERAVLVQQLLEASSE